MMGNAIFFIQILNLKKQKMQKIILTLLSLITLSCTQPTRRLQESYLFLLGDGGVDKIAQSNDTYFVYKCYYDKPCAIGYDKVYKIISQTELKEFSILKLERLNIGYDSSRRFSVIALKWTDSLGVGKMDLSYSLTKSQLDTVHSYSLEELRDGFFYTYFSQKYLASLAGNKKVSSMGDIEQIKKSVDRMNVDSIVEKWKKTKNSDIYASAFTADIMTKAYIQNGYNPVGAGPAIRELMEKQNEEGQE